MTIKRRIQIACWQLAGRLEPGFPRESLACWAYGPHSWRHVRSALARALRLRVEAAGLVWPWEHPTRTFHEEFIAAVNRNAQALTDTAKAFDVAAVAMAAAAASAGDFYRAFSECVEPAVER